MTTVSIQPASVAPALQPKRVAVVLGKLLSIADQIQAFNIARKTGEIRLLDVPQPGYRALLDGEVVHAQYDQLEGIPAAIALIHPDDAPTEFIPDCRPARRSIHVSHIDLLVQAARLQDE